MTAPSISCEAIAPTDEQVASGEISQEDAFKRAVWAILVAFLDVGFDLPAPDEGDDEQTDNDSLYAAVTAHVGNAV